MLTRNITIISSQGDIRVQLTTNVATWGELKAEINKEGSFNANECTAMIRGLRTELVSPSDALPESDFSLFITPSKIKSGK